MRIYLLKQTQMVTQNQMASSFKWSSEHAPPTEYSSEIAKHEFLAYKEKGERIFSEDKWDSLSNELTKITLKMRELVKPSTDISSVIQERLLSSFGNSEMVAYFMNVKGIPFQCDGVKSIV